MEKNQKKLYYVGWAALAAAVAFHMVWVGMGISRKVPCLFFVITGFYCPGCGGTRALGEMLEGHFLRSLWYHPAILYGAVLYSWFMVSNTVEILSKGRFKIGMKYRNWYIYGLLILMLVHMMLKNILLHAFGLAL